MRDQQTFAKFNPAVPIEEAWTPPAAWYTSASFFEHERRDVFHRTWQPVGRIDQVAQPGDYFTGVLLGEPFVVLRDQNQQLRAYSNVCRHHAAQVAQGEGTLNELVCPYHGWTYGLDGCLQRAPRIGRIKQFDADACRLPSLAVEVWGPFVFIHLGQPARTARADLMPLEARLSPADLAGLRFVARRSYTLACNWKVYVDNYLDGGYHVPYLHGGLAGQLDLDHYQTETFDRLSIQSCSAATSPDASKPVTSGQDSAARIGGGAVYGWLYPNFMINRYGPFMDTNWIVPLAHDRTETVFDYYLEPAYLESLGKAEGAAFLEQSLAASDVVQQEDVKICEAVQVGLGSASYDRGRYAPTVEMGEHHFHRLLAEDLRGGMCAEK